MVVAEIDRDYLWQRSDADPSRVGRKFEMLTAEALIGEAPKVRWRTKTDDGDLCYGGWLLNDSECEVQLEVLRYCEHDVGATIIEVRLQNPLAPSQKDWGARNWLIQNHHRRYRLFGSIQCSRFRRNRILPYRLRNRERVRL